MSYKVSICALRELVDVYTEDIASKMIEVVKKSKELMLEYYQFERFLEDNYGTSNIEKIDVPFTELIKEFEDYDLYYEFVDKFDPMWCDIYITQYAPSNNELLLLAKHCPNIVWVEFSDVFHGFALTGAGVDMSDRLELAYYIVDRESPIKARDKLLIGDKEWEAVLEARKIIKEQGVLDMEKILGGKE